MTDIKLNSSAASLEKNENHMSEHLWPTQLEFHHRKKLSVMTQISRGMIKTLLTYRRLTDCVISELQKIRTTVNQNSSRINVPAANRHPGLHQQDQVPFKQIDNQQFNHFKVMNDHLPDFKIKDKHLQSLKGFEAYCVEQAISESRIIYKKYRNFPIEMESYDANLKNRKKCEAMIAFMLIPGQHPTIEPFAIQLATDHIADSTNNIIYTPEDDWSWAIAKGVIQEYSILEQALMM